MKKVYVPAYLKKDILPSVEKSLKLLSGFQRVGVVATAQHLNQLDKAADFLEKNKKTAVVGGQIIGCNQDNAKRIEKKVDCFLFIGSGRFHALKLAAAVEKPVFVANPYSDSAEAVTEAEKKKFEKRRVGRVLKASEGRVFGVIVSTKVGQCDLAAAKKIKKKLESLGRKAFIFAGSEVTPSNLLPFKVDAWVNTACPRISEDEFSKPVINPEDLELLEELIKGT